MRLLHQKCRDGANELKLQNNILGREVGHEFYKEIEIFTKDETQTTEEAIKEQFISKLPEAERDRCVIEKLTDKSTEEKARYEITATEDYIKEYQAKEEGPVLLCGDYGMANGIQYFEFHKDTPDKFLFVRVGQEFPMFDEQNIEFLPAHHIMDNI